MTAHRALLLVAFASLGGCTLFMPLDGFTGTSTTDPSSDGSGGAATADAGGETGASSDGGAGTDAASTRPNLVPNGDVELGCGGWPGSQSSRSTAPGRTGNGCSVCADGTSDFSVETPGVIAQPVRPGDHYRAEVWVSRVSGSAIVFPTLRAYDESPFSVVQVAEGERAPSGSAWTHLTTDFVATRAADSLDFYVYGGGTVSGDCFVVDDVHVERVP